MSKRNSILGELREISTLVANLSAENLFTTPPPGYFDQLPGEIMNRIKAPQITEPENSLSFINTKKTPFIVPQGYFDGLAGTILNRIRATEASTAKEELEVLSPFLGQLEKKLPFNTPKGYFDELTDDVISGVHAINFVNNELEALSPMMSAAKKKTVYQVPPGYFENLPAELLNRAKSRQTAKIIFPGFSKKLVRYAAAAIVAGLMAVAAWLFVDNRETVNPVNAVATLEKLSDDEKVSDDEILSYLQNSSPIFSETTSTALFDIKEEDVKELLSGIPDEELQRYLDQNAVSRDLKTN